MNLQKLFQMQRSLDLHIQSKHNLENVNLFERKILALLVEVGELANETRCFKFWSTKPSSEKDVILEEFVDGLHFILSLGIQCGFEPFSIESQNIKTGMTVHGQFLEIYKNILSFQNLQSEKSYLILLEGYLLLANMLGFSSMDMEEAYYRKNEVNYERQLKGY